MTGKITHSTVAIIGAGPAGLMAAEVLSQAGFTVTVYDAMPSAGRKLLQAGRGGLNVTHSEPYGDFVGRYGDKQSIISTWLEVFNADDLRQWLSELGIETFIGSSGRVYPMNMQAAPLLRLWLQRLRGLGVKFAMRHRCLGWNVAGELRFLHDDVESCINSDAILFAMGGASWARLGSDGAWKTWFESQGLSVSPFLPANCGFDIAWSSIFVDKFAGQPLKNVVLSFTDSKGLVQSKLGEAMLTQHGIEGSLVYALSAEMRDVLLSKGHLVVVLDLMPDVSLDKLQKTLSRSRAKQSLASFFKRQGLSAIQVGLLREVLSIPQLNDMTLVAKTLKQLPLTLLTTRPLDEAISTAGGVDFAQLTPTLMLKQKPGVFCAGEMLDWEAPTGGYLLTAVMASGKIAAQGIISFLSKS
ncbi:MAG: TIGR03862 family flavoprotein [Thiotrichales bacterium]|nr:TIGR03862 family flavoprotein [Thiotrichales bacterium]